MSRPGTVYLIGASHGRVVAQVFERVSKAVPPSPRVAVSLAGQLTPRGGDDGGAFVRQHIPDAVVERFSVRGEPGARPGEADALLASADVIFLGGGDPVLAVTRLCEAGADVSIRRAHARGAVCVGLSAGSIALGAYWASWPEDDPAAVPSLVQCLAVVPDLVVDCHAEADRWEELYAVRHLVESQPVPPRQIQFAGIGHDAALVVAPGSPLEWIGPAKVLEPVG